MKIGLIDVDGHNFPNLALMRISAYHKAKGDTVEWWYSNFEYYDIVYMSKIFSSTYSDDIDEPYNCGKVIKGGTGYCISLKDGKEVYDRSKDVQLPNDIERMFPDYSIYPQYKYAISLTSRGCPRGCAFCHVAAKEGRCAKKVADVKDFWCGQKEIKVLDPNLTACKDKRELFKQYKDTGAWIDFTQGLDIRLIDDDDIRDINEMKITRLHFAWDNYKDDLESLFAKKIPQINLDDRHIRVYVLCNFNSTIEEDYYRIITLRDIGCDPYVMIYNKPNAPKEIKQLQRWCNNKFIFRACKDFKDYKGGKYEINNTVRT